MSYLEGCTAPMRDENQLHAAVVELVTHDDAEIKYSTVQNWYPGDADGKGGIFNFVTKRGDCRGKNSKISWTQVETGSAITWKYPSCILRGDNSRGEFYSIAISNGRQQVDSGTKMIHLGKNTTSRIISKGIAAGKSNNTYRGLVTAHRKATGARNFTNCDSLLIGDQCGAHTVPYIDAEHIAAAARKLSTPRSARRSSAGRLPESSPTRVGRSTATRCERTADSVTPRRRNCTNLTLRLGASVCRHRNQPPQGALRRPALRRRLVQGRAPRPGLALGPNGAGKTTLLRILNGETELHGGKLALRQGHADRPPRPAPPAES